MKPETEKALHEMIRCAITQIEKSELEHIDDLLRGQVNDPDPIKPFMSGPHLTVQTTYGLVSGLLRERDILLSTLNDLLNDCINFDGTKLTDVYMKKASYLLKNYHPQRIPDHRGQKDA